MLFPEVDLVDGEWNDYDEKVISCAEQFVVSDELH